MLTPTITTGKDFTAKNQYFEFFLGIFWATLITSLGLKQGLGPLNEEVGPEKCRTQLNATQRCSTIYQIYNL